MACATLIAFEVPSDLATTSWTPAISKDARGAAPPAITPVARSGRLQEDPAGTGVAEDGMRDGRARKRDVEHVLACLVDALLDGQARLLGLAVAEADPPLPSPITMRAVKEKRRPPFTTFATRLTLMVRSSYCDSGIYSSNPASRAASASAATRTVVAGPTPVEHDLGDSLRPSARSATSRPTSAAASALPVPGRLS